MTLTTGINTFAFRHFEVWNPLCKIHDISASAVFDYSFSPRRSHGSAVLNSWSALLTSGFV